MSERVISPGQVLIVPVVQNIEGGAEVASVEVTAEATFEDRDASREDRPALPTSRTSDVVKDRYGDWAATFELTNDRDVPLTSLRLGVLCRDAAGVIIGGSNESVETLAAGGTTSLVAHPDVSARPATCEATVNETD